MIGELPQWRIGAFPDTSDPCSQLDTVFTWKVKCMNWARLCVPLVGGPEVRDALENSAVARESMKLTLVF